MTKQVSVLLLMVGCATVRPITYPSPCVDRGVPIRCQVTGYEVWGSPSQVQAQAKQCPKSAHVTMDPHHDYGVIRCYAPFEVDEADSVVVVEDEDPPADLEVTLQEAEAPLRPKDVPAVQPEPEPHVQDQPRLERPTKAKRKRRAPARQYDND